MKKLLALQLVVLSSMVAMESDYGVNISPKKMIESDRSPITWDQMVWVGRRLYAEFGEEVDLPELLLAECRRVKPAEEIESKNSGEPLKKKLSGEIISKISGEIKLQRMNTSEKLKQASDMMRKGIEKIISYP